MCQANSLFIWITVIVAVEALAPPNASAYYNVFAFWNTHNRAVLTFDNPSTPSGITYLATADTTYTLTNSGGAPATDLSFSGLGGPFANNGGTCISGGTTLAAG